MQAYSSFSAVFVERSGNSCRSLLARFLFNVEKQILTATVNLRKNQEELKATKEKMKEEEEQQRGKKKKKK